MNAGPNQLGNRVDSLLTLRERALWTAGFLLVSTLIVATRFTSPDADSIRYATLSARLSELPVGRWVAPEWWGLTTTDLSGYFLEHPAGLFFVPAAMGRLGIPADQAPYIFGVGAGLAALLLCGRLIQELGSREDGRASLVLLQVMPLSFVFRVRDNHEYPMLVCLLVVLLGLARISRSWSRTAAVACGLAAALLVKGVFAAVVLMGAAVWIIVNPTRESRTRQIVACLIGLAAMAAAAVAYDAWYQRATGGPFWSAYLLRQLGPMEVTSPLGQAGAFARHVVFYLVRLLAHPAPWSLALVWAGWRRRPRDPAESPARHGLTFVLLFAGLTVLSLSLASRVAERYLFSASFLVGAAGSVVAGRLWPGVVRGLNALEARVPAPAAVAWTLLVTLRLVAGSWLPRMGG